MLTSNVMYTQNHNRSSNPQTEETNFLLYALVFLATLAASLCIAILLPRYGFAGKFGGAGHDGYLELARSLYNGEGYRFSTEGSTVFHRAPLYPALLVPLMGFSEPLLKTGVAVLNSLFLLTACIYTRRICKLLFPQAIVGTIAMALLVCNPWVLRLVSSPLGAIMQMAFYTAICFYLLQFCENFRQYNQLSSAHLFKKFAQITALTTAICFAHGTGVYVCSAMFFLSTLAMLLARQWKMLSFLVMTAALTLTALSPWATRNAAGLDRAELSTSGAGFTYFLGNSYWGIGIGDYREDQTTELNALRMGGIENPELSMIEYWGVTDASVDNQLRKSMIEHASNNPTQVLQKSMLNFFDIFFPITHTVFCATGSFSSYCAESTNNYQIATRAARSFLMLIIIGLAISYLLSYHKHKPVLAWIAMASALLSVAPYLPIATYTHHGIYSLGALPILCSLAAAALYRLRIQKALVSDVANPEETWLKASELEFIPGLVNPKKQIPKATAKNNRLDTVEIDYII